MQSSMIFIPFFPLPGKFTRYWHIKMLTEIRLYLIFFSKNIIDENRIKITKLLDH